MSTIPPIPSLFSLPSKVALITGGSRGIGLHTATAFLLAGCSTVIITARKLSSAPSSTGERTGITDSLAALNSLPGIKGRAVGIASSAADAKEIEALAAKVKEDYGSMLSTANSSAASSASTSKRIEAPDVSSSPKRYPYKESMCHEEKLCSGHCKAIVRRIVDQVQVETEQWSQMQEMLGQVKD